MLCLICEVPIQKILESLHINLARHEKALVVPAFDLVEITLQPRMGVNPSSK